MHTNNSYDLVTFTGRSSHPELFLGKGVLKICSKFTGEQPCRSAISIKLLCNFIEIALCNFIEIALRHGCSPVNLLHIFRKTFLKNTSRWLLLYTDRYIFLLISWILRAVLASLNGKRKKFPKNS